jgi:ubiquinone/menaquinone biosynthesis C-methylase UbiE
MLPHLIASATQLLKTLDLTGITGHPVLDLGCGAGRDTAWLNAQGVWVMGADLSRGMLVEARESVNSPLCQLDMRYLPYRASTFSAVWCQAALLHLPKQFVPAALEEIRRVLVPGGLLHVSVQRGSSEGFETRPHEPVERFYAHYEEQEFTSLIESAGFDILDSGKVDERRPWLWVMAKNPTNNSPGNTGGAFIQSTSS